MSNKDIKTSTGGEIDNENNITSRPTTVKIAAFNEQGIIDKTSSSNGDSDKQKGLQNVTLSNKGDGKTSDQLIITSSSDSKSSSPNQPAKKSALDYVFGKMVGEGSFSSVYLAKDVKTEKEYAIKVCDKQHIIREKKTESIRREKEVMTILSANQDPTAPYFVHLYATFQDAHRLYFVMTFAYGGELLKCLNKQGCFEKKVCQFYSGEIIQALKHLHKFKICHRDLKPENILLTENGHILVTDFGSAKILTTIPTVASTEPSPADTIKPVPGRARSNSFVGTAQYVSPEVLQGRYAEVGPSVDLWALGCIIYQFLVGRPPFQAPSEFLIFRKILSLEYQIPDDFDEDAKDIISKLLKLQFTERLGALDSQHYTSIESHPFFSGINFENLHKQQVPLILSESSNESITSPLKSQARIPLHYEPGFDPRTIAERFLRSESEEDLHWDARISSDESEGNTKISPPLASENIDESGTTKTTALLNAMNLDGQNRCNSECLGSPPRRFSKGKVSFPLDSQDRISRLEEQAKSNPWHKSAKGNLILKQGIVSKRKGLFSRRRMLLLTEGPHLYYCDPNNKNVKGEIPWSSSLKPEAKDFKTFYLHTPNRIYYLEDPEGFALAWCDAINGMLQKKASSGDKN